MKRQRGNMSQSNQSSSGGIGVLGLLGVVFVTLKLCKVIDWSWWWMTAPFWGPFLVGIAILAVCGIIMAGVAMHESLRAK